MIEIATFWDYENIKAKIENQKVPLVDSVVKFIKSLGNPRIMRSYANWSTTNPTISRALYSLGFEPIHVSMGKTNSVDVKIAVDCMETALLYPNIEIFLLITGDKDFIPVINWLKAHNKKVILVGDSQSIGEHLLSSVDQFVEIESIMSDIEKDEIEGIIKSESIENTSTKLNEISNTEGKINDISKTSEINQSLTDSEKKSEDSISFEKAIECLISTIKKNREIGNSTRFIVVDSYMRLNKEYGYNGIYNIQKPDKSGNFKSFSSFIETAEQKRIIKSANIGGFREIFLIDEEPLEVSEFSPDLLGKIQPQHIPDIYNQIEKAYENRKLKKSEEALDRTFLLAFLGNLKMEKGMNYTSLAFQDAIDFFIKTNVIYEDSDQRLRISPNSKEIMEKIVKKIA